MKRKRIKVLYIAGPTRTGSTILSKILGEYPGFFNGGELVDIWYRGLAINGLCGCGTHFNDCKIWRAILDRTFPDQTAVDVGHMLKVRDAFVHSMFVPFFTAVPRAKSLFNTRLQHYLLNISKLYTAIQSVTGSTVIVDCSKNPAYALLLMMIPSIEVHIIHLIRDSRAAAFSWLRKKEGLGQTNPFVSSFVWNLRNTATEILRKQVPDKFLRLRYEAFVQDPDNICNQVLKLLGVSLPPTPYFKKGQIELSTNHSVYGNPNRFETGLVRLKLDDEWRTTMNRYTKLLVTTLTYILLIRYGYSP